MGQTGHHGDDVILDIAKIKANVHAGCDFVVGIAALREPSQDIGFAPEKLHQAHDVLSDHSNFA